jgi:hypothetical protein
MAQKGCVTQASSPVPVMSEDVLGYGRVQLKLLIVAKNPDSKAGADKLLSNHKIYLYSSSGKFMVWLMSTRHSASS